MQDISSIEVLRTIHKGDIDRFRAFIEGGLDVNATTESDKWNFLHRALSSVRATPVPKMIQYLVEIGVDVNARDRRLWAPLHFAARIKNTEAMRILLDGGAEIDPVNDEGITPLRMTLLQKPLNRSATELLLSRGADPEHQVRGCSVRRYAETISHDEEADLIERFNKYRRKH